ncbi:MAG: ATP-binding domain-containing protein [Thermoleophilia bacterium]
MVCKHNDYELGARNGTRGTIDHLTTAGVVVRTDAGERLRAPADYAARHVRHGYALTVHAAQGATVDHAFVLASDQRQLAEWGYVALTRARHGTRIYLTEPTQEPAIALDPGTRGGLDELARAMGRPTAEPLATHQLTDAQAHRDSLSTEARWIRSALAADEQARHHRDPLRELHAQRERLTAARQTTRPLSRARRDLTHQIREVEQRITHTAPTPPPRRPEPPRPELAELTTDQLRTRLNEINELLHPASQLTHGRSPERELAGPEMELGLELGP